MHVPFHASQKGAIFLHILDLFNRQNGIKITSNSWKFETLRDLNLRKKSRVLDVHGTDYSTSAYGEFCVQLENSVTGIIYAHFG